jgi:hypothetical protein
VERLRVEKSKTAAGVVEVPHNWGRCYDFKNIFAEKFSGKIGVFYSKTKPNFEKKLIITLVFEKNAIFSPKIGKNRRKL